MNKEAFDTALQLASTRLRKAAEADPFPDVPNVNNTQPNFNAPTTSGPATNWSAKPGMRMQMSPHAALRRGARAAGNAVGQFAQAPANYMGQVGQSIGNAFNRATGQQSVAPQAAQQQPNTPWMQNPRVSGGVAKMPNRPGQYAGTNQLNSNYSGNGVQTAERRSQPRPDYTQPFVRNPNFRGGVTNTPTQFAPGQTRQQTIDQTLKRPATAGSYLQQARNGAMSMFNAASNLSAAPQQMGAAGQNFRNRIREEKWQPNQPLPPDWYEQRLRSDQMGSAERSKAEYAAAGGFQRYGLAGHAFKHGPKEDIWRGL